MKVVLVSVLVPLALLLTLGGRFGVQDVESFARFCVDVGARVFHQL